MISEIEIEKKYLVSHLPKDLQNNKSKRLIDIYIPRKEGHAAIRIRRQGDKFFITKKTAINREEMKEETIEITEEDFNIFLTNNNCKVIDKTRYYYPYQNKIMEIDIFHGKHQGLVLAEVEFSSQSELNSFDKPSFCLTEVTHSDFLCGGVLCNTSYKEIENELAKLAYKKIN